MVATTNLSATGDGSDDDGGAVPTVYAAFDPDDPEPVRAAGPAAGARRWSYNCDVYAVRTKGDHSPEVLPRLNKFAGGEEKWREWSYDFRMATATQNATVFELLNWIEENGKLTFREIMERNPEGIGNRRFNGMETIDKEIFQHLLLNTQGRQRWL